MLRQQDRVAVVTGGARGIGAATCRRLAEDGAYVVVLDLRQEDADAVAATLPHGGHGVGCDITDRARVEEVVRDIDERLGRIDVLVNNAGITNDAMFYKMTPGAWQSVIDVNLTGTFNITQAVAEVMVDEERWVSRPVEWPVVFFELEDETVWGATGRMLVDLLSVALGV